VSEERAENEVGETITVENGFRLLDQAGAVEGLTVRDDQQPWPWLLDAAGMARRRGRRFRLVDSGRLDAFSLEWLAKTGADLYTADNVRSDAGALVRIRAAGRASGARVMFFLHGPLQAAPREGALSAEMAGELVRGGIDLHISNRGQPRDMAALLDLTASGRAGGAGVVYYHHGPLLKDLADLTEAGAWVHISNAKSDFKMTELPLLRDISHQGHVAGGLVVHVDMDIEPTLLAEIRKSGAHLIFNIPTGGQSPAPSLPWRAFYLDTTFLL